MHVLVMAALALALCGCTEEATFRSSPASAKVYLNDQFVGITPTYYAVPHGQVGDVWNYRVELDGYVPELGVLHRRVAPGRIVAAVFTFGITRAFRGWQYFTPVSASLTPIGGAGRSTESGSRTGGEDIGLRLRRLDSAYDRGEINEREYRQLRAKILEEF